MSLQVRHFFGIILVLFAILFAVGPALAHHKGGHEGGKASGNSKALDDGPRGKSPSRPDQDGIGADKGVVNDDKVEDGNNGCGNDSDREDDNNGRCRGRNDVPNNETPGGNNPKPSPTATVPEDETTPTVGPSSSPVPDATPSESTTPAEAVSPSNGEDVELPNTGSDTFTFVLGALMLLSLGGIIYLMTRGDE